MSFVFQVKRVFFFSNHIFAKFFLIFFSYVELALCHQVLVKEGISSVKWLLVIQLGIQGLLALGGPLGLWFLGAEGWLHLSSITHSSKGSNNLNLI